MCVANKSKMMAILALSLGAAAPDPQTVTEITDETRGVAGNGLGTPDGIRVGTEGDARASGASRAKACEIQACNDNDADGSVSPGDLTGSDNPDTVVMDEHKAETGASTFVGGPVIYVDADAAGGNNGSTWADAFNDLQDALAASLPGLAIWVAEGTYTPDRATGDRNASFQLISGVQLYGGFAGDEATLAERAGLFDTTILSGDLDGTDGPYHLENFAVCFSEPGGSLGPGCAAFDYDGDNDIDADDREPFLAANSYTENSRHVVTGSDTDGTAILDGFTITAGNADSSPSGQGGGLYNTAGHPTIINCTFRGNAAYYGGGLYNNNGSSPTVRGCTFSGNSAGGGGGLFNFRSSPTVTGCTFSGNAANWAGGMYNSSDSNPTVVNCTFSGNSAAAKGGGMANSESSVTLVNCTFNGNSARANGGGIYTAESDMIVSNCVLWGNRSGAGDDEHAQIAVFYVSGPVCVYHSCVQGCWTRCGDHNTCADPLFADADGPDEISGTGDDNPRLWLGSPCIDAGDDMAVPSDVADLDDDGDTVERTPLDLDGNPRFMDDPVTADTGIADPPDYPEVVDMGAYEHIPSIFVDADATGIVHDGSTWCDAFLTLHEALAVATPGRAIVVANGVYTPDTGGLADPREATFQLANEVIIQGGYAGCGAADPTERNVQDYETILSGDLNGDDGPYHVEDFAPCVGLFGTPPEPGCEMFDSDADDDIDGDDLTFFLHANGYAENSYHVVTGNAVDATAVLEGFTLTAGCADQTHPPHNRGGGMYNSAATPTLTECTFEGNFARIGGGACNDSSNPTLERCTFSGNLAASYGGGMSNVQSSPTLDHCRFVHNSALVSSRGGGGMANDNSSPTVSHCTFSANTAATSGGALYNTSSAARLYNCAFSGNSARTGGAIHDHFGDGMRVSSCVFSGNTAELGAGIYNMSSSPLLTNCTLYGNAASVNAGGMSNAGSTGQGSHPTVVNCIFWGNSDPDGTGESSQISSNPASSAEVDYSCIEDCTTFCADSGDYNTGSDPLFVDPDGDDDEIGTADDNLRLSAGSPCIDTGDNSAVLTHEDIDGNPRIMDGDSDETPVVDMGGYEYFTDCNGNGIPDTCDVDCSAYDGYCNVPDCGLRCDGNTNGVPDECEVERPIAAEDWNSTTLRLTGSATCTSDSDCPATSRCIDAICYFTYNRYLYFRPNEAGQSVALRVRHVTSGETRWVDSDVGQVAHNTHSPTLLSYALTHSDGAPPDYAVWPQGPIGLTGCFITPGEQYEIQAIMDGCDPAGEASYSDQLTLWTAIFGDAVSNFAPPGVDSFAYPPQGPLVDVTDLTAIVEGFTNTRRISILYCDLVGLADNPSFNNLVVNVSDMTAVVDAFGGGAYPGKTPDQCW